ncbi:MAG: hypothetical protein DSY77_13450, partial [Bacteroidetes bacterium]
FEFEYSRTQLKNFWKYHYLITKILNKRWQRSYRNEGINKGYVEINSQELQKVFGQSTFNGKKQWWYLRIRKDLKDWGIIEYYSNNYYDGESVKGVSLYRLAKRFYQMDYQLLPLEKDLSEKIIQKRNQKAYKGYVGELLNILNCSVNIDEDKALRYLHQCFTGDINIPSKNYKGNREKYTRNKLNVLKITDGDWSFTRDDKTRRIFNTLTSLLKQIRQFVNINNKPIIELDIANSQPLIFILLIYKYLDKYQMQPSADISKYIQLCETGSLYDFILSHLKSKNLVEDNFNKGKFKGDFFARIFFSTEKRRYKWRTEFDLLFPTVGKIITYYKRNSHADLAINLQREESSIMIDTVSKRLLRANNHEFFNLHDAIYTTSDYYDITKNIIRDAFKEKGLKPLIR